MAEVLGLARRVDPHARRNRTGSARAGSHAPTCTSLGGPAGGWAVHRSSPRPCPRSRRPPRRSTPASRRSAPSGNCSGSTPIPTRFERWMRSKLSTITARTPSSLVPFAAQSREEPDPYSLPPSTTSGTSSAMYLHRRVVDRHLLGLGRLAAVATGGRRSRASRRPPAAPRRPARLIRLRSLMFANVPRIITSWLPRREP